MRISDWSSDVCSSDLGEGLLPLIVIGPQRLHGPSGDGQIAFEADPLDLGKAAQPVVARNVIAAQEGVVGRHPARKAHPPQWIELEPAVAVHIAAQVALACAGQRQSSEEHTSELQSLMRTSYAVFC